MDSTVVAGSSTAFLSDDGAFAAQLNGKDLIIHLSPLCSDFQEVEIVKLKETPIRFLRFSRPNQLAQSDTINRQKESAERRILCASDTRILVWDLHPLQLHAEIENVEYGALNIDFGADENEIIVFHAWNTKVTIHSLDSGRSQVIKSPKVSHYNGFGFRPRTRQLAILLKPETSDVLTIHEYRSYELVNRVNLPTSDAQGLKWSPDGNWIAVWDAASAGTRLLIYTADGNLFRTYNGSPDSESAFDLGVRSIEWSPAVSQSGTSDLLAVGKVDGTIDILNTKTFSCCMTLSHAFPMEQPSLSAWHERFVTADGSLGYTELPVSSAFSMISESSGPPRGASIMAFSANGAFLSTVDQTRPNVVWVWDLKTEPGLVSVLLHDHPVRQVVWHPSRTEFLVTTSNILVPVIRYWSLDRHPSIIPVPISRGEGGKYDVRWLSSGQDDMPALWFGTLEDYVLGHFELEGGAQQFKVAYSVNKVLK
ncbi:hypothetical protein KXW98_002929 [Aspergillus fumigatus]|nr:hypothetical protein CNMCM8686_000776 [Aspergillus fumigatus]KAH1270817.1 hypothetical protein KXX45_001338 [Aspergillus fumigatus]KAH1284421.1 hypothetical protein KXX30_001061 [Aspergillus fumigatus]KAH1286163.1 hypothetical protein KXX48_000689 [Aspergillus fumigatus]KAH1324595.1 hypothetical protein KXX66_006193 [Aspergillus fumigatus]